MTGLCLALGAAVVALGTDTADLRWTHSVQKTEWRETWQAGVDGLYLLSAAVQGSGAGMEPGEGAVLRDGFWTWQPRLPAIAELPLTRSSFTGADWQVCIAGQCRPLGSYFPGIAPERTIRLGPCP